MEGTSQLLSVSARLQECTLSMNRCCQLLLYEVSLRDRLRACTRGNACERQGCRWGEHHIPWRTRGQQHACAHHDAKTCGLACDLHVPHGACLHACVKHRPERVPSKHFAKLLAMHAAQQLNMLVLGPMRAHRCARGALPARAHLNLLDTTPPHASPSTDTYLSFPLETQLLHPGYVVAGCTAFVVCAVATILVARYQAAQAARPPPERGRRRKLGAKKKNPHR